MITKLISWLHRCNLSYISLHVFSACPVCYLPVEEAIALMPMAPSFSPIIQNLTYISEEYLTRSEFGGSEFGGYPSLKQRTDSYDIRESMSVHCGYDFFLGKISLFTSSPRSGWYVRNFPGLFLAKFLPYLSTHFFCLCCVCRIYKLKICSRN